MKLKSMCIALAIFFICCGLSITFAYADNKGGPNQSEVRDCQIIKFTTIA